MLYGNCCRRDSKWLCFIELCPALQLQLQQQQQLHSRAARVVSQAPSKRVRESGALTPASVWVSGLLGCCVPSIPYVLSLALWKTGQKLTASQLARSSNNGRFFYPGQHGPITSACRPPLLPIRTISTTQNTKAGGTAVPDLQLSDPYPSWPGISWGQTTTFGGEPSAASILPVHPTKNLHNISRPRGPPS